MADTKNWIYSFDDSVNARYVLGQPGIKNLLVIGVNPSTATPEKPDLTIRKVIKISKDNGYDGWIMVNLYPQRSTDPKGMVYNQQLVTENLEQIKSICEKYKIKDVWCAWGDLIDAPDKKIFLHDSWNNIENWLRGFGATFYHYGTLTGKKNPRHPSRVGYNLKFHKL